MARSFFGAPERRTRFILVGIIVGAVLLRLPALLSAGLWRDDANLYVQLIAPNFNAFFDRMTGTEWHPPLYFFMLYLWTRFAGTGELALNTLPFVFSILTVPAVYRLGKAASSAREGLVAAGLYALSPLPITYSTEYLYPLMGFLCTVLATLVLEARRDELSPRRFVFIAAVTLLVVYTHYVGLLFVPVLMLWALTSKRGIKHATGIVSALFAGALPFIFWLPQFLLQRRIGIPYTHPTSLLDKIAFFFRTLTQLMPVGGIPATLFLVLAIISTVVLIRSKSIKTDSGSLALVFLSVFVLAVAENLLEIRYVLPLVGLLYAYIGWAAVQLAARIAVEDPVGWRRSRAALVIGIAVVLLAAAFYAIGDSMKPKSGIRALVKVEQIVPSTLYVIAPDYLGPTFAFYTRNSNVKMLGFVRAEHPEVFRLSHYAADWNNPVIVKNAERTVAREASRYQYLALIVDARAQDMGSVPYGKVWQLLNGFSSRYRLVSRTQYPGRWESISEYRFLIGDARARSLSGAQSAVDSAARAIGTSEPICLQHKSAVPYRPTHVGNFTSQIVHDAVLPCART